MTNVVDREYLIEQLKNSGAVVKEVTWQEYNVLAAQGEIKPEITYYITDGSGYGAIDDALSDTSKNALSNRCITGWIGNLDVRMENLERKMIELENLVKATSRVVISTTEPSDKSVIWVDPSV